MATLSGSAACSLVNVHCVVGFGLKATCAGWPGGTVWKQGESHARWCAVVMVVGTW